MTIAEATAAISAMYAKLLRYPVVTLTLVSPRPIKVAVTGEVSRRGSYDLTGVGPENNSVPTQFPTVTRALKIAGGITQAADLNQVQIRRVQRGGNIRNINVNLWHFLRNGDNRQDAILRDSDTIFVPTAKSLDLNESYQLATTSFSAEKVQPLNITVIGEVYRPGTHTVESSVTVPLAGNPGQARDSFNQASIFPTLTRALQSAGGIKSMANIRAIQVRRITQNGTEQTLNVDLWALLKDGDQKQDLILQDRDTIVVPVVTSRDRVEASTIASSTFSPDRIRVNVIGEIERPGLLELPPNVPLTRAIVAAGGFNRRADRKTVEFIRLNSDGSILKRDVPVNFAAAIDDESNPTLQNEDVMARLTEDYDLVIYDTPAIGTLSDALLVASHADGLLLVTRIKKTKQDAVAQAIEALEMIPSRVLGLVANDSRKIQRNSGYPLTAIPFDALPTAAHTPALNSRK